MIGGSFVVRDGRIRTIDYGALRDQVERANERLRAQAGGAERLVRQLEGIVGQFCVALAQEPYHVHRYVGMGPNL